MNTTTVVKSDKNYVNGIYSPASKKATDPEQLPFLPMSLWQSPGGSLYYCIEGEFVCFYVHASSFRGWINKVAIRNIHLAGNVCCADQAFRNMVTGQLSSWEQITLDISEDRIVKHFPAKMLKLTLVNGPTEVYTRVYEQ